MDSLYAGSGAKEMLAVLKQAETELAWKTGNPVLRVMSVDPGKVTGVSVFWYGRKAGRWEPFAWAETMLAGQENIQVLDLRDMASVLTQGGPTDFVIEDFRVMRISMEQSFLSPVRIGRKFEWDLHVVKRWHPYAVQFVFNSEMAAMSDLRLKSLGFFTPGPDHRRDATRHNLLHVRALNSRAEKRMSVADKALSANPAEPFSEQKPRMSARGKVGAPSAKSDASASPTSRKRPAKGKLREPNSVAASVGGSGGSSDRSGVEKPKKSRRKLL